MPNPFAGIVSNFKEGARNNIDPTRPARLRQESEFESMRGVLAGIPNLPPHIQQLASDPNAFAAAMKNPSMVAAVTPPKPAGPQSPEGKIVADLTGLSPGTPEFQDAVKAHVAAGTAGEGIFGGTGLEAQMFNQLLARVPEDQREQAALEASQAFLGRERTSVDPRTGQPVTSQLDLSPVLARIAGATPSPGGSGAGGTQPAPSVATEAPAETPAAPVADLQAVLPSGGTLFDQSANLTGPDSLLARVIPKTPGLGGLTNESSAAAQLAETTTDMLVDALRLERSESTRAKAEIDDLRERFGFQPETFSNPEQMRQKAVTARLLLDAREQEILARQSDPESNTLEGKRRDLDALARIRQVQPLISPPVLQAQEAINEFFANPANVGARVVIADNGKFTTVTVGPSAGTQ